MITDTETAPAKKWQPSPSQRLILESLSAEVAREKSAAEFARLYCDFGPSKLSRILDALDPSAPASYFDKISSPEGEVEAIDLLVSEARNQRAIASRLNAVPIIELSRFRAVAQALRECKDKRNPERLVKYLAPTGGGKTMLCNYLADTMKARVVEVREAWKRSYFTVLTDIAKAVGARFNAKFAQSPTYIENKLIEIGNERSLIIALDEGEFFGSSALNGIKTLLNKSRYSFLICCIPEAHDRWNDYYTHEADQIARRCHSIVRLTTVPVEDIALFFPESNKFTDPDTAHHTIAEAASKFGHYSLVARVAEDFRGLKKLDDRDLAKAISRARKQMLHNPDPATADKRPSKS